MFVLLIGMPPGLFLIESYANKIQGSAKAKHISVLTYEFDCSEGQQHYYSFFTIRRLCLFVSLYALHEYPILQITVSLLLSHVSILHLYCHVRWARKADMYMAWLVELVLFVSLLMFPCFELSES